MKLVAYGLRSTLFSLSLSLVIHHIFDQVCHLAAIQHAASTSANLYTKGEQIF